MHMHTYKYQYIYIYIYIYICTHVSAILINPPCLTTTGCDLVQVPGPHSRVLFLAQVGSPTRGPDFTSDTLIEWDAVEK